LKEANPCSGGDRSAAKRLREVALADTSRAGEAEVLVALKPFQRREKLERRVGQLAGFAIEPPERLGGREPGGFQARAFVGRFARGDLFANERGEQLCVFAVASSSGASSRMPRRRNRRRPASSSGSSARVTGV
jgi:hypothetical protein